MNCESIKIKCVIGRRCFEVKTRHEFEHDPSSSFQLKPNKFRTATNQNTVLYFNPPALCLQHLINSNISMLIRLKIM